MRCFKPFMLCVKENCTRNTNESWSCHCDVRDRHMELSMCLLYGRGFETHSKKTFYYEQFWINNNLLLSIHMFLFINLPIMWFQLAYPCFWQSLNLLCFNESPTCVCSNVCNHVSLIEICWSFLVVHSKEFGRHLFTCFSPNSLTVTKTKFSGNKLLWCYKSVIGLMPSAGLM